MYHVFSPVYLALFFIGPDKQAIFQIAIATVAEPLWDDRQSEKDRKKVAQPPDNGVAGYTILI